MEGFGARLPWNRRKRRRLARASNIIVHVFAGENPKFWENQLSTATTEVICVDLLGGCKADLMDRNVYGYLLQLAASGRLRTLLGGPPCRTISAFGINKMEVHVQFALKNGRMESQIFHHLKPSCLDGHGPPLQIPVLVHLGGGRTAA